MHELSADRSGEPDQVGLRMGWLLLTWGNFVAYSLVLLVFVVGATVRLPGARREVADVESQRTGTSGRSAE